LFVPGIPAIKLTNTLIQIKKSMVAAVKDFRAGLLAWVFLLASCAPQGNMVFICASAGATRYHATRCRGLNACTHPIKKVTLQQAEQLGKTACRLCY
jgi:hypothetical protein